MSNKIGNHILVLYAEDISGWMSIARSLKLIPKYRFDDELYERRGMRYKKGVLQVKLFGWWINLGKRPKFKNMDFGACDSFLDFGKSYRAKLAYFEWCPVEERSNKLIFVFQKNIPDREFLEKFLKGEQYTMRVCNPRLNRRMVLASKSVWDLRGFSGKGRYNPGMHS